MPRVSCARCFVVFDSDEAAPGSAPLCPSCAPRAPGPAASPRARPPLPAPRRARRRGGRRAAGVLALALVLSGAAAAAFFLLRPSGAEVEPRAPTAVETQLEGWRAAGLLPAAGPRDPARASALVAAGRAALAEDLPRRTAEALRLFREAIALDPDRPAMGVAGYAEAFAESAGEDPDGAALRSLHDMVHEALEGDRDRPELLAAYARLLLVVPSAANIGEARAAAERALRAAPGSPPARIALALAQVDGDPDGAVRTIEQGLVASPPDRRALTAAARARWAAGDAAGALAHADARLALDPGHPGALALRDEIQEASSRIAEARATLARWDAAEPGSPLPPLLLARLAYQHDGDLAAARRLLEVALSRDPGDFVAARVLAHRAAVERAAGDLRAAAAAVEQALQRVPGSAPARFQAALLAYLGGSSAALRESAGVLGDRGGSRVASLLAARSAELSGTDDEAQEKYLAVAALSPRDPALLLSVAGALARLRAPGPALALARQALARDPLEGRLARRPTDYWEGPAPLAEAARRLEAVGRREPRGGATSLAAAATAELLLGRTVAAERLAREANAASPQDSAPLVLLAQVALDRGRSREAVPLARQGVELRPGDAPALEVYARVQEAFGRNMDAEATHRRALEAAPDLATARLALARLLARRGAAEARGLLEGLLRDDPDLADARGALLDLGAPGPRGP